MRPLHLIAAVMCLAHVACSNTASERRVLLDLYRATGGDKWRRSDGWGQSADVCSWSGVHCSSTAGAQGRVVEISLENNNVEGSVPNSLGSLESLRRLSLSGNRVRLPLPEALVRRWARGALTLVVDGSIVGVEEIELFLSYEVQPLVRRQVLITQDGQISETRVLTSGSSSTHCEVRDGATQAFDRLAYLVLRDAQVMALRPSGPLVSAGGGRVRLRSKGQDQWITLGQSVEAWSTRQMVLGFISDADWGDWRSTACQGNPE